MTSKLDRKWANQILDNVNALILEVERLEAGYERLETEYERLKSTHEKEVEIWERSNREWKECYNSAERDCTQWRIKAEQNEMACNPIDYKGATKESEELTSHIKKVNDGINKFISEEIERQVTAWVETAKGVDFANLLERTLRENTMLKEENAKLKREVFIRGGNESN